MNGVRGRGKAERPPLPPEAHDSVSRLGGTGPGAAPRAQALYDLGGNGRCREHALSPPSPPICRQQRRLDAGSTNQMGRGLCTRPAVHERHDVSHWNKASRSQRNTSDGRTRREEILIDQAQDVCVGNACGISSIRPEGLMRRRCRKHDKNTSESHHRVLGTPLERGSPAPYCGILRMEETEGEPRRTGRVGKEGEGLRGPWPEAGQLPPLAHAACNLVHPVLPAWRRHTTASLERRTLNATRWDQGVPFTQHGMAPKVDRVCSEGEGKGRNSPFAA